MLFTSLEFLFFFLPIVLIVYFVLTPKVRNYWLLAASLFFYAWGEPKFLVVMLASIVFNWLMGLIIEGVREKPMMFRKAVLSVSILGNLSVLFVYKYMNFATSVLRELFPRFQHRIPQTSFLLPIGISFFTFQAISYVIDVYRGHPAQKNPFTVALFIALFPQLVAGPIVRYRTIENQIQERHITLESFSDGVMHFLYGFNKKVLLANILSECADAAFGAEALSLASSWMGVLAYSLQIYFDFSGYSEMAIGLGKMFGFDFPKNFDYPYISQTITEFWRRWHISLGTWFRDYLYFPLGGSRVGSKMRLAFNLGVVWLATGIWHGASWNFIVWGMMHGVFVIFEKLTGLPEKLKTQRTAAIFYRIIVLLVAGIGWLLFRAEDLSRAGEFLRAMVGLGANGLIDNIAIFNSREYIVTIVIAILASTPFFSGLKTRLSARGPRTAAAVAWIAAGLQFVFFIVSISCLVMSAHNPFIYFNF